jgi:hypothetical protein
LGGGTNYFKSEKEDIEVSKGVAKTIAIANTLSKAVDYAEEGISGTINGILILSITNVNAAGDSSPISYYQNAFGYNDKETSTNFKFKFSQLSSGSAISNAINAVNNNKNTELEVPDEVGETAYYAFFGFTLSSDSIDGYTFPYFSFKYTGSSATNSTGKFEVQVLGFFLGETSEKAAEYAINNL